MIPFASQYSKFAFDLTYLCVKQQTLNLGKLSDVNHYLLDDTSLDAP